MAVEDYSAIVKKASEKYGVSESLINAVIRVESDGNPNDVSSAGAIGLMQLMPGTAKELGVSNPYDPEQNIMGGTKYLSQMIDRYDGDVESALAAYNAGSGNVKKYGKEKYSKYYTKVLSYMGGDSATVTQTNSVQEFGFNWNTVLSVICIIGLILMGIFFLFKTFDIDIAKAVGK